MSNLHYYLSDCLDVPPNIPDIFKKAVFWPRKNNSATKKRAAKVKIPSVATSLAWRYYKAKEMEKSQHQIAVEERKRKRQETAEKKKQEVKEKKRQKALQQAKKASKKK